MDEPNQGIYVVDVAPLDGRGVAARYVIVAESAWSASLEAIERRYPSPTRPEAVTREIASRLTLAGRVGTFDPGLMGARLTAGSPVIAHMLQ